ncbi:MAG: hypothetical protein H7X88_08885 [Gloeobacteraceae cyanobacterium ES-bin-316]|nr:hypothetical protein [Ferruginibacter sp.]
MLATKLLLIFFFLGTTICKAQNDTSAFYERVPGKVMTDSSVKMLISSITIKGNKKTKKYIIAREMLLKIGDSVVASDIYSKLSQSQELIYNTALFTEVTLVPQFFSDTAISILVTVKEKWYIYPTIQFQLIDRNFNEWISTADLERVTYGAKFAHYNLSGRRDQLRVNLLTGYSRNFAINYTNPYSNHALTEGFSIGASYTQNREVIYNTTAQNLPLRYTNNGFVRNSFSASGSYIMRKGFYRRHVFSIGYSYINVDDSITKNYNPAYFNRTKNFVGFIDLGYNYQYTNTNNINYPLTGKILSLSLTKRGLASTGGINMFYIDAIVNKYVAHTKNWYSSIQTEARVKLPFKQAYINQRSLGYGDQYLQGLEKYIIDGVLMGLAKYTLKRKLVSFKIPVPVKNKLVSNIPITIFAKTYANAGYSYNQKGFESALGNRLLYTGGFGIDILTLYDLNIKLEYSFNQLGEKGLFLHAKGGF